MPYITQDRRKYIDEFVTGPIEFEGPGELNYAITVLLADYLYRFAPTYKTMNAILGALEGAKEEFYRRIVVPYEETKREKNGDVYRVFKG